MPCPPTVEASIELVAMPALLWGDAGAIDPWLVSWRGGNRRVVLGYGRG